MCCSIHFIIVVGDLCVSFHIFLLFSGSLCPVFNAFLFLRILEAEKKSNAKLKNETMSGKKKYKLCKFQFPLNILVNKCGVMDDRRHSTQRNGQDASEIERANRRQVEPKIMLTDGDMIVRANHDAIHKYSHTHKIYT